MSWDTSSDSSDEPRKILPERSTVTVSGSLLRLSDWPLAAGRSTGRPDNKSGAVTMKTMSNTSITSTKGVTLISCIGVWPRARPRRPPLARPVLRLAPIGSPLPPGAHVDLTRHNGGEFVGKGLEPLAERRGIGGKLVVEDHRRDRCQEAEGRGKQRLGDARGDHGQVGIFGHRN